MPNTAHDLGRIRGLLAYDPTLAERVILSERPWEGKIFQVERLAVELSDSSRGVRELARHHGGAGVVAVREAADGSGAEVCLVRQWRVVLGRVTLEIPAGKLDADETGASCAARELSEETGLQAQHLTRLVTTLGSPGFTDEHTEVFLATGLSQHEAAPDPGELVRVSWLPADEVVAAIQAGLIQDAKTVAGVLSARVAGML